MALAQETVEVAEPIERPKHRAGFWYPYLLIAPTMLTLTVVSLVPFIYAIYLSLYEAKYGRVTISSALAIT